MPEPIDITEGRRLLDRFNAATPASSEEMDTAGAWHEWLLDNGEHLLGWLEETARLLGRQLADETPSMYTQGFVHGEASGLARAERAEQIAKACGERLELAAARARSAEDAIARVRELAHRWKGNDSESSRPLMIPRATAVVHLIAALDGA
ncbi:hypothetical protein [Rhodococcus ruber]|uniref:hypothetical protein n=1 Tax=Rhodococcus ruber TaxID=1830 RepID=UPI0037845A3D